MSEKQGTAAEKKAEAVQETKMYIGPTFAGVAYASVYKNGVPAPLQEKVEKYPVFAELLIPLNKVVAAKVAMEDGNSAISKCIAEAKRILREEN